MLQKNNLDFANFRWAVIVSLLLGILMICLSLFWGKHQFFLMLNGNWGTAADYFFQYFTHLGDGLFWAVWLIWVLVKKRKYLLPMIISSFVFNTIITQICKQVIFPSESRPASAITDGSFIHLVEGVTVHSINSFPSGHTATAFTFVLLISLTLNNSVTTIFALIIALLVGYSRIYLAQHFPFDVGGGIIVAVISVSLAVYIQKWLNKKRTSQAPAANIPGT